MAESTIRLVKGDRISENLFGREVISILKKRLETDPDVSKQQTQTGEKAHVFDMKAINNFKIANTHHSSCIEAKKGSITGLGFKQEKVEDILDDLTEEGFQDVINRVSEDFCSCANGYIEVIRESGSGKITGLHHLQGSGVYVYYEGGGDYHYILKTEEGSDVKYARFGEGKEFATRVKQPNVDSGTYGELIPFRERSSLSRWYGVPSWLAGVSANELVMCILQHNYDFFNNRGVPEFMLFVLGGSLGVAEWEEIQKLMKSQVGLGNTHKSMALNIPNPDIKIQIEKLMMEQTEGGFSDMLDSLSLMIVSAHRVPPLLAQIQIPGKLGANNELPNALMAFQALVVGPAQRYFVSRLAMTLGNQKLNGGLGLKKSDFEFNTILDHVNLEAVTGASTSRTPVGPSEQSISGQLNKMKKEDRINLIGAAMSSLLYNFMARIDQANGSRNS